MEKITNLIRLFLIFALMSCCGLNDFDNAYDPKNATKDADGDGIPNGEDKNPTESDRTTTTDTKNDTSTSTSTETGTTSDLIVTTKKFPLSVTLSSAVSSLTYRSDTKTLYAIDDTAKKIFSWDISSSSPVTSSSLTKPWSDKNGLSAWSDSEFFRMTIGDGVTGKIYRYDSSFSKQSELATDQVFAGYGGGTVSDDELLVFKDTSESPSIYKMNIVTGTSSKIGLMDCTKLKTEKSGCPVLNAVKGYAQAGGRYWVLGGELGGTEYLIGFDASAVEVGMAKFELPTGETTKQMTGDGSSVWILTEGNLLKITPE